MNKMYPLNSIRKTLSSAVLSVALLIGPSLIASSHNTTVTTNTATTVITSRTTDEAAAIVAEAGALYNEMNLENIGMPIEAFENAYRGYKHLVQQGIISRDNILSVADFSQSSKNRRLYILDLETHEVIMQTYVAHGRGSGGEFATSFSNRPESNKSSLGFYVTKNTYLGKHGLSLKLDGLEKGINDNAEARSIVIHGANYIGDRFLNSNPFTGRSLGCPAVASRLSKNIINTIKDGSILFIYHPTTSYLNKSRIING